MIKIYHYGQVGDEEIFARVDMVTNVETVVTEILANVRENGDAALFEYAAKFDQVQLESLEVTQAEIDEAFAAVEPEFLEVLREAAANIRAFHEKQLRNSFLLNNKDVVVIGQTVTPIEKVGLYVPGGTAAYPSTVLMDSTPARTPAAGRSLW